MAFEAWEEEVARVGRVRTAGRGRERGAGRAGEAREGVECGVWCSCCRPPRWRERGGSWTWWGLWGSRAVLLEKADGGQVAGHCVGDPGCGEGWREGA